LDKHGSLERVVKTIMRALNAGAIKPVVRAEYSLEDAPKAHHFIHDCKNIGKVVLKVR
jgi:NADPH:quinone reductase-like Zn-dependent oxidoreductase